MPLSAEPILPCAQLTGLLFESPLFCRQHLDLLLNVMSTWFMSMG